ncbi:MAG: hypothetical protein P4K93_07380 [Terracidiphilus sp.]|nr:hypothetical protein [Terracidiphilus sp.]
MIDLAPSLLSVGGARTGIAPANLLDVENINGGIFYWADRTLTAPSMFTGDPVVYLPWLLGVPSFTFNRSTVSNTGNFKLQNVSGNTLARDVETQLRASALEGAFFVYRCWQADAEASWIEVHGTLTLDDNGVDTVSFKAIDIFSCAQDDTPLENYCETCQLQWGGPRCGSTQANECQYSFQSCQVVERIMVALNNYEKNYGETSANTPLTVINRTRRY